MATQQSFRQLQLSQPATDSSPPSSTPFSVYKTAADIVGVKLRATPVPPASDPHGMVDVKYTVLTFYLVTFVAGLVGNTLVLYVVARYSEIRRRSVSNYYMWNLALADELFVFTLPFFCYATWTGDWIFGNFACKVGIALYCI